MPGRRPGLTAKQSQFVDEYLVDNNATQAAIRAGYSEKTANQQASRLLANVKIANVIAEAQESRSERIEFTADDVMRELIAIVKHEDEDALSKDRIKSLELIGKHLGMFKPVGGADNPLRFKAEPIDLSGWSSEDLRALSRLQAKVAASGSGD